MAFNFSPHFGDLGDFLHDPLGNISGMGQDFGSWFTGQTQFNAQTDFAREMWKKNANLQRQFAKMGIRWRVADAKAAGLHPLAALGSSGASGSPITVGMPDSGQGVSPNAVMQMFMSMASQRGVQNAQARYYNALADQIVTGQSDSIAGEPGRAVVGGGSSGGRERATTQKDFGLVESPQGGLVVGQSSTAQGMDEDPGGAIRRLEDWNYIRSRSNEFVDMRNRKGVAWERYKANIMSKHPGKDPGPGKMWQWSVQSRKWQSVPAGNPKFEETTGLTSPAPIHKQVMEVLKQVIDNSVKAMESKPNPPRAYPVKELGRGRGHYPEGQPGYKRRSMWEKRRK